MTAIALALLVATSLTPKERAHWRELVSRSMREANAGDFDRALKDATAAYEMNPAPALLYNLGQIHRLQKDWDKAAYFFERFLATNPEAKYRARVQKLLDEVRAKGSGQASPAPPPPQAPAPAVIVTTPPAPAAPAAAVSAPPEAPEKKARIWPWVEGGAGLAAAAASAVGFVQVGNYYGLKSASQQNAVDYTTKARPAETAYGWGMPLGVVGAVAAVALFTTMAVTW